MSANAPAVNAVTLVGNLTADPVLRTIDEHRKVCEMRLAVNDQNDQPPLFIDVATFASHAEACAKYLAKGRAIAVTGRLIYREWVADDGTRPGPLQISVIRAESSPSVVRLRRCFAHRRSANARTDRAWNTPARRRPNRHCCS